MKFLAYVSKLLAEQGGSLRRVFVQFAAVDQGEPRADGKKLIQLFPLGEITTVDGEKFDFKSEDLEKVTAALREAGQELPAFVHHWDFDDPVGWVDEFHVTEEGLFGWVRWIAQWVVDKIRAETLKYTSPGFFVDADGRLMSIIEVSLTNTPRLQGMRPVEASLKPDRITSPLTASTEKGKRMKKLRAALGLADDASDEVLEEAALAALEEKKKAQEQAAQTASLAEVVAEVKAKLVELDKQRENALQAEQAATIDRYIRDAQLTRAEADALGFDAAMKLAALRKPGDASMTRSWYKPGKAALPPRKEDLTHEQAIQMAVAKNQSLTQFYSEYFKEAN